MVKMNTFLTFCSLFSPLSSVVYFFTWVRSHTHKGCVLPPVEHITSMYSTITVRSFKT